jgi:dihydropteroate synthase
LSPGRAALGDLTVGDGLPVAVVGVVNLSPASFYAGSVHTRDDDLLGAALGMVEAGATLIDVGARSTAPYLDTEISEAEEGDRLASGIELLVRKLGVPISADTARPGPARAALDAGARVINDVSGLRDPAVAALVVKHRASVILMSSPDRGRPREGAARPVPAASHADVTRPGGAQPPRAMRAGAAWSGRPLPGLPVDPVEHVKALLGAALERARAAGIPEGRIVVDPGIGFFRDGGVPWHEWDCAVLAGLSALRQLGRPLCVGVSRKSFVGAITGRARAEERLSGSLAAAAIAVWNGAALIRTHDAAETLDAVRVAERLRRGGAP